MVRNDLDNKEYSLEELETIASDTRISVPQVLEQEISGMLDSLEAAEKILNSEDDVDLTEGTAVRRKRKIILWIAGTAVVAASASAVFAGLYRYRTPQDTFSDPEQAYAEVTRVLGQISDKISVCTERGKCAEYEISRQMDIVRELY